LYSLQPSLTNFTAPLAKANRVTGSTVVAPKNRLPLALRAIKKNRAGCASLIAALTHIYSFL